MVNSVKPSTPLTQSNQDQELHTHTHTHTEIESFQN